MRNTWNVLLIIYILTQLTQRRQWTRVRRRSPPRMRGGDFVSSTRTGVTEREVAHFPAASKAHPQKRYVVSGWASNFPSPSTSLLSLLSVNFVKSIWKEAKIFFEEKFFCYNLNLYIDLTKRPKSGSESDRGVRKEVRPMNRLPEEIKKATQVLAHLCDLAIEIVKFVSTITILIELLF